MRYRHPSDFDEPWYTQAEVARCVGVSRNTLRDWCSLPVTTNGTKPFCNVPLVTRVAPNKPDPETIPFIGMAEAVVMTALLRFCNSTKQIRPAVEAVIVEMGIKHPHASKRFQTEGAEIIYNYDQQCVSNGSSVTPTGLVKFRNNQHTFVDPVLKELESIQYYTDGYPSILPLVGYKHCEVIADPCRSGGQPIFAQRAIRIVDITAPFSGGESLDQLAQDYDLTREQVEDAVRTAMESATR